MKIYKVIPRLENERILNLWRKAQEAQWSSNAIDWDAPRRLTSKGTRDKLARILTPVLMSEQSAFHSASNLIPLLSRSDETESAYYLSTWLVDEARHAELFARLFARLDREPLSARKFPGAYFFQAQIMADDPAVWLAGLMVVEVMAKMVMHEFKRLDLDSALSDLADGILKDEARHLGFNRLYVEDRIARAHREDEKASAQTAAHLEERLEKVLDYAPTLFTPLKSELADIGFEWRPILERMRSECRSRMERAIKSGVALAEAGAEPVLAADDSG